MIFCKLTDLDKYQIQLTHSLSELKDYIIKKEADLFQKGKFEIKGNTFFGIGLEYETKNVEECSWEAHRKYLDVHYILEGEEIVEVTHVEHTKTKEAYNDEHDYQLFNGESKIEINCKPGDVLILEPEDIHKTGIINMQKSNVLKIVFKILLQ